MPYFTRYRRALTHWHPRSSLHWAGNGDLLGWPVQCQGERVLRKCREIVLGAQVRGNHPREPGVPYGMQYFGSRPVGKVTVGATHAAFEEAGIPRCFQQLGIVVGLDHERVTAFQLLQYVGTGMP